MPDRHLINAIPGQVPRHQDVQQLIETERGLSTQGVRRSWQASDSTKVVLTSDSTGVKISRDNGTTPPRQVIVDGTQAGGVLAGTYPSPGLAVSTMDLLFPPGIVWSYAGGVTPTGWIPCDGRPLNRTTYAKLFAAIGTLYGVGDGTTTFNVPNLVGRVPLGASGAHPRGQTGGAETVAGPAHTHPGNHAHNLNSHAHDLNSHTHGAGTHVHGLGGHTHTSAAHVHPGASHTHGMTNHDHSLNGHTHNATNLGVGGATGSSSSTNGLYTAGGATATTVAHTHDNGTLDVTGNTDGATGNTSGATNYTGGSAVTGGASAGDTGSTTPPATDGSSVDTAASTGTTAAAVGSTAAVAAAAETGNTNSAPAPTYTDTIATMPPFGVVSYIIWPGA